MDFGTWKVGSREASETFYTVDSAVHCAGTVYRFSNTELHYNDSPKFVSQFKYYNQTG